MKKRRRYFAILLAVSIGATLCLGWGCLAHARENATQQDNATQQEKTFQLGEVVVTSGKRETTAQETPESMTVLNDIEIEDYGITDTERIFQMASNIHLIRTGPPAAFDTFPSVRGITGYMAGEPPLGLYIDDVYYPGFDMNLVDIDRIEVLRGPQGTLYGRNSEGGVISITSKLPTNLWETSADLGYSSYNTRTLNARVSGPLVEDKALISAAMRYRTSDGYYENIALGEDDPDRQEDLDGRLSLLLTPTPDWDIRITGDLQNYNDHNAEFQPMQGIQDGDFEVNVDEDGISQKEAYGLNLRAEHDFGPSKLLSITSYRDEQFKNSNDIDFTPNPYSVLYVNKDVGLFNEEIRFLSDTDSPWRWLVGASGFYEEDERTYTTFMDYPSMGGATTLNQHGTTKTTGMALFGETGYTFWDRLELVFGLRYDHQLKDFDYDWSGGENIGVSNTSGKEDKSFDAWLPKFSAKYKLTENISPYVTIARGFKSGGFNLKASAGEPYDSEFTWSYEGGVKSSWFENKLVVNLAAFYIDWDDIQVELTDYPDFTYVNGGKATSKGVELEIQARPLQGLELIGSIGYTDAKYDDFYDYNSGVDYSGKYIPNVPKYTAHFGATYHFLNGLFLGADYSMTGKNYFSQANTEGQSHYNLLGAKIGYEADNFNIYLWGKNLLNTKYATRAFEMDGDGWYGRAGAPLTVGVQVGVSF
jgi:iron complex outermembrane receptor protein